MPGLRKNRANLSPVAIVLASTLAMSVARGQELVQAQQSPPAASLPVVSATSKERIIPLEVSVNGAVSGQWALLERNGILYAPADAFEEWRIKLRATAVSVDYRGQTWYPLTGVPGFEARFNFANQSVDLVFSPASFAATRLARENEAALTLTPAVPSAFVNYDISYTGSRFRGASSVRDLSALTELGFSGNWGVLTSSYVGRNLTASDPNSPAGPASWRRLETVFSRDFPESTTTLRIGDTITRTGVFGNNLYYGGVQLTRNFALRPGFITQPIPVIAGTSSAPSTVDLYINDALRQTSSVPTGPFTIDNFPLITGTGEARVVVRDVLGRETVVVQPFFTHNDLLEEGLSDWSFEAGKLRRNLGQDNANYGATFASGLWRQGLSKSVTAEAEGKLSADASAVSLGLSYELPLQSLGLLAISRSRSKLSGQGSKWAAGVERTSLKQSFTARVEGAGRDYRELGWEDTRLANRMQISASYNYATETWGAWGLGYARINTYDRGSLSTASLNYSMRVGQRGALSFTATRVSGSSQGNSVGATLLLPLESGITVSSSVTRRSGETDAYISASRSLSSDTGTGWRALAGTRADKAYSEGGVYVQGDKSLLTADISASRDQQTVRLGAQGGAVAIDGRFFASRRVDNSFALVEVAGYPDVSVGFQGSKLTHTDKDGVALLPRLQPYQRNSIRLDPSELPISAEIDNIELVAVPASRTGVKVTFPVRSGRAALIKIDFDDGEAAPAGALVTLGGDAKEFFVARRGEAFITGMQAKNNLRLAWNGQSCNLAIELPAGALDDITRIGPVRCSGVKR
ncbi:outer membrane usher protein [Polaromonas sp. YR568]|nr:outer membrane usher protein [Polaromonas sp. YR568]